MTNVATFQTAADLSASITAQGVSSLVPAGVILAFGGATAPTGWLLCEGALVSRTTYANLYAAILNAHGSGDGTTTFALPDYRGRFIRGRDNSAARDPDRTLRTAAASGGNTADAVGSVQSVATSISSGTTNKTTTGLGATTSGSDGTHSHGIPTDRWKYNVTASGASYQSVDSSNVGSNGTAARTTDTVGSAHSHTITVAGDNETRPLNAYVNYIIKI